MERIVETDAAPGLIAKVLAGSLGAKPAMAIGAGLIVSAFFGGLATANHFNSHAQLKAERAERKLEVKRLNATITIQKDLVAAKEEILGDYKDKEVARQEEVKSIRADYAELRAKTPVDTVRYLKQNEEKADAKIGEDPDTKWIRNDLPDWMLDDFARTLARPATP